MAFVVFTGGARSGKSAAAQSVARLRSLDGQPVVAVVFGVVGEDAEMADRVAAHQAERPPEFRVIEVRNSRSALKAVDPDSLLLFDCVGTLVGMVMAEEWPGEAEGHELVDAGGELPVGYAGRVEERVNHLVRELLARQGDTIIVTNEVGDGVVPAYASGRLFRDVLGRANRSLVARADRSYLTVCGRLVELSALPATPAWPED
jgi:adenosyl cobinamide kinase/adenosyl cobinamide phosphate guanylyltransferase